MSEVGDWDLVARARSGDTAAFAELVRRYQTPVIHFCLRMTGSIQDAEELAQDTFVRVHRYLARLTPRARFSTLLFGVARNLTLNFLRDAKRRGRGRTLPLDAADGRFNRPSADGCFANGTGRPDQAARLREIEGAIEEGMARLAPHHREVLILREVRGLDYAAIAQVCHCRIGTVRSRLARAREQLRRHMAAFGGEAR